MKETTNMWQKINPAKLMSISLIFLMLLYVGRLTLTDWQMQPKEMAKTTNANQSEADEAIQAQASDAYGKLPLSFELNQGQTDEQVKFLSQGSGYSVFLNSGEVVTRLRKSVIDEKSAKSLKQEAAKDAVLGMKFVGGNPQPIVAGVDELPGKVNYFIGNDPKKWNTEIPTFAKVKYTDVYPNIDAVFYGNQKNLEFDFIVAPGADPKTIELTFETADKFEISDNGELVLNIADDKLHLNKPVIYQEIDGKRQFVTGGYVLNPKSETGNPKLQTVGFRVDDYDVAKPLIIDPILAYSTYFGSNGSGEAVAVDSAGHAFVTGTTGSINFPGDVFVTKFYGDGSALAYTTYFGGSDIETGFGIAVDNAGNAYLTGVTYSLDFPTLNAVQTIRSGTTDAFITKLNATGSSLVFSTYLGGGFSENINEGGIAIDTATNVYVTGRTESSNFPTTPGAFQTTFGGGSGDTFVVKLNASGSNLAYSTFLGGNSGESSGSAIEVDMKGNAYVTGGTSSANFPTTPGAFQPNLTGISDAYAAKLNPSGSALVYATFLGGQGSDFGEGIAVDVNNQAYITGGTNSTNFPTTPGAFQTIFGGGFLDVFVTKLNSTGSA
ncbi:MAG: SBBP repeat-containing protein, partial [Acidobacteriota bacterium]|nr:SBBP repeat-containing protein [Acidobacteriota bacterium]